MTKKQITNETNLNVAIAELRDIAAWFEGQEEIDVEVGLQKIKEGATLVKACRARLKELENTFDEVRKELNAEE
jgi:exonuclease VII small subunit